ncbi:MAG: GNAT family N-acetyltransferase [Bacteroidota bacterium]
MSAPEAQDPSGAPLPLDVRPVETDADWAAARALRQRVFVEEQECPPEEEWDAHDWPEGRGGDCRHLIGTASDETAPHEIVGVCRWRPVEIGGERWAKLERFAVAPEARGHGYGRALVTAALADARTHGHSRFILYAQDHLRAFYQSWGFSTSGDVFWEAGLPHVKMLLEG